MKSVQLSELGPVAEDIRNGETIEVRDGERVVAMIVPFGQQIVSAHPADGADLLPRLER